MPCAPPPNSWRDAPAPADRPLQAVSLWPCLAPNLLSAHLAVPLNQANNRHQISIHASARLSLQFVTWGGVPCRAGCHGGRSRWWDCCKTRAISIRLGACGCRQTEARICHRRCRYTHLGAQAAVAAAGAGLLVDGWGARREGKRHGVRREPKAGGERQEQHGACAH